MTLRQTDSGAGSLAWVSAWQCHEGSGKGSCQHAWLQEDGGRFRELHEAHIARLAAESRLAEVQARLASASASAGQQVTPLIHLLRLQSARQSTPCRLCTGACCVAMLRMTPCASGTFGNHPAS